MTEKTTALENLASDFHWVPGFVAWIGDLITDLGPLIALAGAIYIYYRKSEDERKALRRDERRKVYAEYLHQCGLVWNEVTSGPVDSKISMRNSDLKRYFEELRLLAPIEVYERAFELRVIYVKYGAHVLSLTPLEWRNKTEAQNSVDTDFIAKLNAATDELITAMRADLE